MVEQAILTDMEELALRELPLLQILEMEEAEAVVVADIMIAISVQHLAQEAPEAAESLF